MPNSCEPITLSASQTQSLRNFYQINSASGHCDTLMEIFQIYLASAKDETLDVMTIRNHFYIIKEMSFMIKAFEPAKAIPAEAVVLKFNQS